LGWPKEHVEDGNGTSSEPKSSRQNNPRCDFTFTTDRFDALSRCSVVPHQPGFG
jgi:hypothetical protein